MRALSMFLVVLALAGCGRPGTRTDEARGPVDAAAPATDFGPRSSAADAPEPRKPQGDVLRFERGLIVDASGFEQPVAAASLFVPYGWRTSGGVVWGRQHLCTNGYNFEWRSISPDGSSGVAVLPQTRWENTSYGAGASTPGCSGAPYTNARGYVEAVAAGLRPGARVVGYRTRPDLLEGVQATRTPMPMGEARTWAEAGEALIAWRENGRDMRGSFAARVSFQAMITDMSGMMQNGPSQMSSLAAFAEPGWFAWAPQETFRPAYFEFIRRSIEPNRAWASAIAGHNTAIARVAQEENAKRARMIAETNDYVARLRQETWEARQDSAERQLREFGEVMKGVETYDDASAPGGRVELDAAYKNAWRLDDGTYVLSNDAGFDPNRDMQIDATRLDPTR